MLPLTRQNLTTAVSKIDRKISRRSYNSVRVALLAVRRVKITHSAHNRVVVISVSIRGRGTPYLCLDGVNKYPGGLA